MKAKEIRELSVAELETKLRETRDALLHLRLRKHTGQVDKTHLLRAHRKDIARLLTIINEKKKAAAVPAAAN